MIDPKLNELVKTNVAGEKDASTTDRATSNAAKPRPGLSINDTIAAGANLSVGARGTDTSGVRAGAGAGGGSSFVTAGSPGESPAPVVAPGPTGSGTTPLSTGAREQTTSHIDGSEQTGSLSNEEIASHAYRCWHERGCPDGSPEEDWHRAERELRERRLGSKSASAKA